jgi:hypothetical protein
MTAISNNENEAWGDSTSANQLKLRLNGGSKMKMKDLVTGLLARRVQEHKIRSAS